MSREKVLDQLQQAALVINQLERAVLVVAGNAENAAKDGEMQEASSWAQTTQVLAQSLATVRTAYISPHAPSHRFPRPTIG